MPDSREKQRMMAGEMYLATDPQLVSERQRARRLTRAYNLSSELDTKERQAILAELFGKIGPGADIEPPFHCDYGFNIFVGSGLFLNFGCVILDCNTVSIGSNVMCGPYVQIYAAYHPTDPALRLSGREMAAPVHIGDNVWIGGGAIIFPGVNIGNNSTIGAGSVVTADIPDNVIAAGNPCRVLRSAV